MRTFVAAKNRPRSKVWKMGKDFCNFTHSSLEKCLQNAGSSGNFGPVRFTTSLPKRAIEMVKSTVCASLDDRCIFPFISRQQLAGGTWL